MRILKYLWFNLVATLTAWMPDLIPVLRLRGFLMRPAFKSCGRNFQVARRVAINFTNRIEIGDNVYLAPGCWLHGGAGITLEDNVQVGPYAVLVTGDHRIEGGSYRRARGRSAPIRLCKGSWIGAHVTITKGVTVGRGAAVGANAVATRDIPDFAVAVGVPATVKKVRSFAESL